MRQPGDLLVALSLPVVILGLLTDEAIPILVGIHTVLLGAYLHWRLL